LVVVTPEAARIQKNIDLRTRHRASRIRTADKTVEVEALGSNEKYELTYDKLIIATGASPIWPSILGVESTTVRGVRSLADSDLLKMEIARKSPNRAVIIGDDYVGLELAESFTKLGLEVTILTTDRFLGDWHVEIAHLVQEELEEHGIRIECGVDLRNIALTKREGRTIKRIETSVGTIETDLILTAMRVRPNVALARDAGIRIGATGAIAVDQRMQTNIPDVFAAGDCAESYHLITKQPTYMPLGDVSYKQGTVAGANAAGAEEIFKGVLGSSGFRIFALEVARTGLDKKEADGLVCHFDTMVSTHQSHAYGYPNSNPIIVVLRVERTNGKLLGAEMAGRAVVGKRVDVLATALHAQMTVHDIATLDLVYAPAMSPLIDPVISAARAAAIALGSKA
jgi:NADPH-dependent 2,4-dienoyl-CoA reductase/sulfur reductase-like enzyme